MPGSAKRGRDSAGRVRVGPRDRKDLRDALLPYRHGKWWNWDATRQQTESPADLMARMRLDDVDTASQTLDFAESVARTALDRADAADRRATTIAGTVAVAASFTVGGAGLLLDTAKWHSGTLRICFAAGLCLTTALFVLAAFYALRALTSKETRRWNRLTPATMWAAAAEPTPERRLGMRAAHLLDDFAANWEIADLKNRTMDNALRFLVAALVGLTAMAVVAAVAAL